jgi:hypothetical protein
MRDDIIAIAIAMVVKITNRFSFVSYWEEPVCQETKQTFLT